MAKTHVEGFLFTKLRLKKWGWGIPTSKMGGAVFFGASLLNEFTHIGEKWQSLVAITLMHQEGGEDKVPASSSPPSAPGGASP